MFGKLYRRGLRKKSGELSFQCNLCDSFCLKPMSELSREVPSCDGCGSTVRVRAIIQVLSLELFGQSLGLNDFPKRLDIAGLGMSDWEGYAGGLAKKFAYTNTFYHKEPRMDLRNIDLQLEGKFDFVISSEVFEHIPPPVSLAFENTRRLLKPTGVLIFSAPYSKQEETVEHFPELYDYRVVETDGIRKLVNVTRSGASQVFDNLTFHGGEGSTLEMRVFSESSLIREFQRAGFTRINIHKSPDFEHGIYWRSDWSLPMSVRI